MRNYLSRITKIIFRVDISCFAVIECGDGYTDLIAQGSTKSSKRYFRDLGIK